MSDQKKDGLNVLYAGETTKRSSATDLVINKIKELLLARELKPGDLLPPENDLAAAMNVSRGSVREAMKVLAAFGVVEIKRGNGTYIAKSISRKCFDPLLFNMLYCANNEDEMSEIRECMELGVVKAAVRHATAEDLQGLRRILQKFAKDIENPDFDEKLIYEHEQAFHKALGASSHNQLLDYMYEFLMDFFQMEIKSVSRKTKTAAGQNTLKLHTRILEALEEKDLKRAERAITVSVKSWHKFI